MSIGNRHRTAGQISGLIILVLSLLFCHDSRAETRYVSDILVINIKSSTEAPFEIVDTVISDEPLEIIRSKDKYFYVETKDGQKGWIAQQYVKNTPPKSQIIEQLRSENAGLSEKLKTAQSENDVLQEKLTAIPDSDETSSIIDERNLLADEVESLRQQLEELMNQPDIKAGQELERLKKLYRSLMDENEALTGKNNELNQKLQKVNEELAQNVNNRNTAVQQLQEEMKHLKRRNNLYWFAAGAIVLCIGMVLGKAGNRKKNKYVY